MSRSDRRADRRRRRSVLGVGTAAGAAFAAALIGLANVPAARADAPDLDPYEDLFGTAGINTWTPTADTGLGASAGGFDTSVDNFLQTSFPCLGFCADDPFTLLAHSLDPSAFSLDPTQGLLPDNAIGDLAVGLDYTLFASGLGPVVDVPIDLLFGFDFI
jgi:hypothetical protein